MAIKIVRKMNNDVFIDLRDKDDLIHSFDLTQEDAIELYKRLEQTFNFNDWKY